jgi:hypothetical protein
MTRTVGHRSEDGDRNHGGGAAPAGTPNSTGLRLRPAYILRRMLEEPPDAGLLDFDRSLIVHFTLS